MTLKFTVNGKSVSVEADANKRLINILRDVFHLTGAKCGCLGGICGACAVIFNGQVSPACLIPAFRLNNCDVTTIESFALTDSCKDIIQGFKIAGVQNCEYCESGKILIAEQILQNHFDSESTLRIKKDTVAASIKKYEELENLKLVRENYLKAFEKQKDVENVLIINGNDYMENILDRIMFGLNISDNNVISC